MKLNSGKKRYIASREKGTSKDREGACTHSWEYQWRSTMQSTRQPLSRAESDEAENSMASARIHDTPRYPRFSDHLRDGA